MDQNAEDLRLIQDQERRLVLPRFDLAMAWDLGCRLKLLAETRGAALAIEIRLAKETVFFCTMPGAAPNNADWARRKRNMVEMTQRSSYSVALSPPRHGLNTVQRMGLPPRDYVGDGGSFPIRVAGVGCVGVVTVSGLPQREDHELVVEALAGLCGVPFEDVRLPLG